MSSSADFLEARRISGQKTVRTSEKSNFSQTCNLLSQYLKEKGSFGDLSFGMTCNPEGKGKSGKFCKTANTEISGDVLDRNAAASCRKLKAMDLFPQRTSSDPSTPVEDVPKKADFRPKGTQLTMFYAGKVVVLDNFPAEKAKEIMLFASKVSSQNTWTTTGAEQLDLMQEHLQANASDLPIARKASLHRFMEKRKDRISARAPYQLSSSAAAPPSKQEERMTWLGLAPQLQL